MPTDEAFVLELYSATYSTLPVPVVEYRPRPSATTEEPTSVSEMQEYETAPVFWLKRSPVIVAGPVLATYSRASLGLSMMLVAFRPAPKVSYRIVGVNLPEEISEIAIAVVEPSSPKMVYWPFWLMSTLSGTSTGVWLFTAVYCKSPFAARTPEVLVKDSTSPPW